MMGGSIRRLLKFFAQTFAHFCGGSFGERDHQEVRNRNAFIQYEPETPRREGVGLARAGAGDEQQVA